MFGQIAALGEAFATPGIITHQRPFTGVHSLVHSHSRTLSKFLTANLSIVREKNNLLYWNEMGNYITFVGFLPRMRPDVLLKRLWRGKLFPADCAGTAFDYLSHLDA
jgi:hypothetical protein